MKIWSGIKGLNSEKMLMNEGCLQLILKRPLIAGEASGVRERKKMKDVNYNTILEKKVCESSR